MCQGTDGKWFLACAEMTAFKTTSVFDEKFVFDLLGRAKWGICSFSNAVLPEKTGKSWLSVQVLYS